MRGPGGGGWQTHPRHGYPHLVQWRPLNVIALVQGQSDNINRMITIAELALI
jgi:hypothetical protein